MNQFKKKYQTRKETSGEILYIYCAKLNYP